MNDVSMFKKFYWRLHSKICGEQELIPPGSTKCVISENRHGMYCVPISAIHRPACRKVMRGEVYEPETIELMIAEAKDGDIVHAGTFFGDFLPALSKAIAKDAYVWAFEPVPHNYFHADLTLRLNRIENVKLTNAGLGSAAGTAKMSTTNSEGKRHGGGSHIVADLDQATDDGLEEISLVSIDDTVPKDRSISILQLDVEGYEGEALKGAIQTIRRCSPLLILENLPKDEQWFKQEILDMGYTETGEVHGNKIFRKSD